MMVGKPYIIDLVLSKDMTQKQVISIIDGFKNKSLIDTTIPITPKMRACLIDPAGNFKHKRITDSIQNTTLRNLIRWQWQVTPLVEGVNYLSINVDIYLDDLPQSVLIYNGQTFVYSIEQPWYDKLLDWILTYWDKIMYVISGILVIFAWLYKENIIKIFKK